jgi:hypothetical protein
MREILRLLESSEGKSMTRRELDDELCPRGFRSDNVLRSIRTLDAMYEVAYREGRFPETCTVVLFQPVADPIPDDVILKILEGGDGSV